MPSLRWLGGPGGSGDKNGYPPRLALKFLLAEAGEGGGGGGGGGINVKKLKLKIIS